MKNILKKILNPSIILIIFVVFVISLILFFMKFDYTYKKLKALVTIFYILPGLVFFCISSIYNFILYKDKKLSNKLVILTPLIVITGYFVYLIILLIIS